MHPEIKSYLEEQRVGVLAVTMPDGTPHGATIHYAHSEEPLKFIFLTTPSSRKAEAFMDGKKSKATFVVGTDEETMKTFQLDGEVELVPEAEEETIAEIYVTRFPEKSDFIQKHGDVVYFTFTPTWWRYSDFKRKDGKLIVSSDQ
jgi:uncharacterized protein YhbP (UPF0306 family)